MIRLCLDLELNFVFKNNNNCEGNKEENIFKKIICIFELFFIFNPYAKILITSFHFGCLTIVRVNAVITSATK